MSYAHADADGVEKRKHRPTWFQRHVPSRSIFFFVLTRTMWSDENKIRMIGWTDKQSVNNSNKSQQKLSVAIALLISVYIPHQYSTI